MKKGIVGIISSIVLLLLLCSGAFADILRFFAWLFTLQYAQPDTSVAGGIVVRIMTFLVSYGLVGLIFNVLGWFNSKAMSVVYFIISTLLGFALAYVVWAIEQYILIIGIVLAVILSAIVAYIVVRIVLGKKTKEDSDEKTN